MHKNTNLIQSERWMETLWDWADKNALPYLEYSDDKGSLRGFPRNKNELLTFTKFCPSMSVEEIPKELFYLTNLTVLQLSWSNLSLLPQEIGHLLNLIEFEFSGNNLIKLPKEIGSLKKLKKLSLDSNQLIELPKEISNLVNLQVLDLYNNPLKKLPEEIYDLPNLHSLWLGNNNFIIPMKKLCYLNTLSVLSIFDTPIKKLPKDISNLVNLTELRLVNTQIANIPKEIGDLTKLTFLDISQNKLKKLPKEIINLTSLKKLHLDENQLSFSLEQKKWLSFLQNKNCEIIIDTDIDLALKEEKKEYISTQTTLTKEIKTLAYLLRDYRKDEGLNPSPETIETWINQFSSQNQKVIIQEIIHILNKIYITEEDVNSYLITLIDNLTTDDADYFWSGVSLLDIQKDGSSQKIMVEKFQKILISKFNITVAINDYNKEYFIYIDDIMFSGMKLRTDITTFMANCLPKSKLNIFYLGCYSSAEYYIKNIWLPQYNTKNIIFNISKLISLENKNNCQNNSDVLFPTQNILKNKTVKNYLERQGKYSLRDNTQHRIYHCKDNNIFSNEKNREILELEFTLAGLKINSLIKDKTKKMYWKPLGISTFTGLGFGAFVITYRNCPNNTPLALWWGDRSSDSTWKPLLVRKTYQKNNIDMSIKSFF